MREIELTTMVPGGCLDLLSIEKSAFLRICHQHLGWAGGWNAVLQIGLHGRGADVSEISSAWLENLVDMHALRRFTQDELRSFGGRAAFASSAWPQGEAREPCPERTAAGEPVTSIDRGVEIAHSLPWTLDTRLFCYRRDLLERAGIPEEGAFATPEAVHETLRRLQARGIPHPLAMATGGHFIHNMTSWIWGRGGSYRTPDFRKIALVEPEARQGMRDYFSLHPFLSPEARDERDSQACARYLRGDAAVLLTTRWALHTPSGAPATSCGANATSCGANAQTTQAAAQVRKNTAYAPTPGVPYVGSTHLVIWRHSKHEREAMALVAYLAGVEVQARVFLATGSLPARLDVLDALPLSGDPGYQAAVDCIRRGRALQSSHLWAGIELRLNALARQLWQDLFANPSLDLDREIGSRVSDLAVRLERTILKNW